MNYKYIIAFFGGMLLLTSCSDFLDDPIEYNSREEVVDFHRKSRGIINEIYTDYAFNYFNDFSTEYLTDNGVSNNGPRNLGTSNWSVTESPFNYVWGQSYDNIRQIQQYIKLVHDRDIPFKPAKSDSVENARSIQRYYGEAHFLKAWAEWKLLKIFGGPSSSGKMLGFPIVNSILPNKEAYNKLARDSYDDCVNQIMKDIDVAIVNLPLKYQGSEAGNPAFSNEEVGRASGLAGYALKAKVALFAASPAFNPTNDQSKWEQAAQYAYDAIQKAGGLVNLQAYNYGDDPNPDFIWRLRTNRNNNNLEHRLYPPSLYGNGEVNPSENLVEAFPAANGYPVNNGQSNYDASNPYANRDARFYNFIFYNGDTCFNSPNCQDYAPLQIYPGGADYYGGFIKSVGTRTGYYLKKFLNKLEFDPSVDNATTNLPKVYVQLSRTRLYLQYAEAANEAYGQPATNPAGFTFSAKDALGKIRQRAGFIPDPYLDQMAGSQDSFRKLLRNERRIELCFTGERFHDLRRWETINQTSDVHGVQIKKTGDDSFSYQNVDLEPRVYNEKNNYLPIPYEETLVNKNLVQNKGW